MAERRSGNGQDLIVAESPTAEPGRIAQIAINLFNGWGYNFYRRENQLRADDLMVRARVCEVIAAARHSVETAEKAYRRDRLPTPTREKPRPDPEAVRDAQALERLAAALGGVEGHIRALPAPENDRMTQRLRAGASTLARLLEADQAMAGHAEFLRDLLVTASADWMLEHRTDLAAQVAAIDAAVQARRELLA